MLVEETRGHVHIQSCPTLLFEIIDAEKYSIRGTTSSLSLSLYVELVHLNPQTVAIGDKRAAVRHDGTKPPGRHGQQVQHW